MGATFGLEGKRVLVTGASRGIGYGVSAAFVAEGARVSILAEDAGVAAAAEALSAAAAHPVEAITCDVTDTAAVHALSGRVFDVLVNNAGLELETALADPAALATFQRIFDINVTGMFRVTQALAPTLADGAAIINTASVWGRYAPASYSAYAASKHAVIGLTRSWAKELGPRGIRVNAVCPGWVATGPALNTLHVMAQGRGVSPDVLRADIEAMQDLPGLMDPADVASLYLFLASPLAANITGQAVNVDRGEFHA